MKQLFCFLLAVVFLSLFNISALAQVSADVTASANVVATLTATKTQDVNFGLIEDDITTSPAINTDGTTSGDIVDNTGATPGYVTIEAQGGQTISVTVPTTLTLNNQGASVESLTFTPEWEVVDGTLASGATSTGTNTTKTGTQTITMPADGNGTIIIGGTLSENNITGTIDGGTYANTFTVTIDYTF